jgi:hypothetical protein
MINFEGQVEIAGGHQQEVKKATPQDWCDYYGVSVKDGIAILYKGVNTNFMSYRGGDYTPGTMPRVEKFKPEPECAPGVLYFSPSPRHTHQFVVDVSKTRYLACPVRLEDIVTHPNGEYPEKVKAIGVCAPVYEVTIDGDIVPIAEPEVAA